METRPDTNAGRLRACGERYNRRRAEGKAGWADESSYASAASQIDQIVALNLLPERFRFLELGCGNGNNALRMAAKGHEAFGIDIVPEAIDWARAQASEQGFDAHFTIGSVVDLGPYGDGLFDFVFDAGCLPMVIGADREQCVRSVFRVLRTGGLFLAGAHLLDESVKAPVEFAPGARFDPEGCYSTVQGQPTYYYSREQEFRDLLAGAGFDIIREQKEPRCPGYEEMTFCAGEMTLLARKPAGRPSTRAGTRLGTACPELSDRTAGK